MAMIWILFGTVMLSMFTASITTGLITACLSNDISLAGKKVGIAFLGLISTKIPHRLKLVKPKYKK